MMHSPIEQRGGHVVIAKNRNLFTKNQIRSDNNAGSLIKRANQMEQQRAISYLNRSRVHQNFFLM